MQNKIFDLITHQ